MTSLLWGGWNDDTHKTIKAKHERCTYCQISLYSMVSDHYAGAYFFRVGLLGACPRCARVMEPTDNCLYWEQAQQEHVDDAVCGWVEMWNGHNALEQVRDLGKMIHNYVKPRGPVPPLCPKKGKLPPAKMLVCGWCVCHRRDEDCGTTAEEDVFPCVCHRQPCCAWCAKAAFLCIGCAWCRR